MKLVYIFGPQAVGKMTVGQELAKITGLNLFHNHMTIDLVSNFFPYNSPEGRYLVNTYRMEMLFLHFNGALKIILIGNKQN